MVHLYILDVYIVFERYTFTSNATFYMVQTDSPQVNQKTLNSSFQNTSIEIETNQNICTSSIQLQYREIIK